jgi:hypothetical protein
VQGYKRADELSHKLADVIEPTLRHAGVKAAANFRDRVTDHLTAAAPHWTAPAADEVINVVALVAQLRGKTDPVRTALVKTVMGPALDAHGIAWDITNPFTAGVLAQSGSQIVAVAETTQLNVMRIVTQSYNAGLSIPDTAKAIRAGMRDASKARARLIARTEMTSAAAGGSLAATRIVAQATGQSYAKVWRTAPGAEYPRHENYPDLDRQTVPLDADFQVGDDMVAFPGDPSGSAAECANCRCTLTYAEASSTVRGMDASAGRAGFTMAAEDLAALELRIAFAAVTTDADVAEIVAEAEAELPPPTLKDYVDRRIEPPVELARPVLDRIPRPSGAFTASGASRGSYVVNQRAQAQLALMRLKRRYGRPRG